RRERRESCRSAARRHSRGWLIRGIRALAAAPKMRAFARYGGLMKTAVRLAALTIVLLVGSAPGVASADAGDPQAFIATPADGCVFPQGANVQFGFFCTSNTSFVISCDGNQPSARSSTRRTRACTR